MILANGDFYDVNWKDAQYHGFGIYTSEDGYRYEGEWKENKMYGEGIETWPDGDSYQGGFVDGKRQGHGKYKKVVAPPTRESSTRTNARVKVLIMTPEYLSNRHLSAE